MISLTTIALNEIDNVDEFVAAVKSAVGEIVIVDTGSTDGTQARLRALGCVVIETTVDNGLSAARNLGLADCSGSWILSLDLDERPEGSLLSWVKQFVKRDPQYNAAAFQRENYMDGELRSEEMHTRLFRAGTGRWEGTIHEFVVHAGKCYKAPTSAHISHHKTAARQRMQNERYLNFYPKLNLGSGGAPMPTEQGWINYDLDPGAPQATQADVFELLPGALPAAHILASHILEHASYHRAAQILKMWIDKLAPGGTIEVRVPDMDKLIVEFAAGKLEYLRFLQLMFGGQSSEWDYHCIGINQGWLTGQLTWWGCVDVTRLGDRHGHPHELRMSARKPL